MQEWLEYGSNIFFGRTGLVFNVYYLRCEYKTQTIDKDKHFAKKAKVFIQIPSGSCVPSL